MNRTNVIFAVLLILVGCDGQDNEESTPSGAFGTLPAITNKLTFEASGIPNDLITPPSTICTQVYSTVYQLRKAASLDMAPGTTLCLKPGIYENGLNIKFGGTGSAEKPIKIAAEIPGKTKIANGLVSIKLGGEHVQLQGFVFEGVTYNHNLIETRTGPSSKERCFHCRITEVTVLNPVSILDESNIIRFFGENNSLDHSVISGKKIKGP